MPAKPSANVDRTSNRTTDAQADLLAESGGTQPTERRPPTDPSLLPDAQRLEYLLEAGSDGIWEWDLATGVTFWTGRARAMLGLAADAATVPFDQLKGWVHADDQSGFERFLGQLVTGEAPCHVDLRLRIANDQYGFFHLRGQALCDNAGTPQRAVGSLSDVTARRLAEEALRHSEQRHRALLSVLTSIVWRTDPGGNFVEPQISWQSYTGQTWDQHRGLAWRYAIHADDRDRVMQRWSLAVERKHIFEAEGRLWNAASGGHRYVAMRAVPMFARDGEVREWVGLIRDIDDQKRAEFELRKSEERLRQQAALLELAQDAIMTWDPNREITFWNRGAVETYGFRSEEAIGANVRQLLQTEYPEPLDQIDATLERTGRWQGELVHRRADGMRITVESRWALLRDKHGNPQAVLESCRDVTDRRRFEHKLREAADYLVEQRQWLEAVLNLLPIPMLLIDPASARITFSNRAARATAHLFAVPKEVHGDESLSDARANRLTDDDGPVARVARGEKLHGFELQWHRPDGTHTLIANSESLPAMHSHERVAVLIYQDITGQKRVEEVLRRSNQAKDALLAMLGHELRNPLAAITSATELLELLDPSDPEFAGARDILHSHIQRLVQLVDDMLDVSRLTSGKIRIRHDVLDLREIVHHALHSCESLIHSRHHRLTLEVPDEPMPIEGDAARLDQVFVNLLTNAAKYTEEGGQITVAGELTASEAVIRVRDTGMGIPPELLPQVFEMFRQLNPSLHRAEGGLGIGLNIVKNLVEMHGGSVAAYSEGLDRGSEFVVRLPRSMRTQLADPHTGPASPAAAASTEKYRVLVVEDNADIAHSMVALLRHLGHEVELAHDGNVALNLAAKFAPQVAFFDIGLPGMNGLQLAEAFRRDERLRNVFLIALTGFGQAEDRRRSLAAGFDEHLVKPLSFDRLQLTLSQAATRKIGP